MPTHHSILRSFGTPFIDLLLCKPDHPHHIYVQDYVRLILGIYPIPVYLGNQETRFHANVGVLAMKWNVIDTRGAFDVPRRTSSLLDVRGEALDAQKIKVEDTQVS